MRRFRQPGSALLALAGGLSFGVSVFLLILLVTDLSVTRLMGFGGLLMQLVRLASLDIDSVAALFVLVFVLAGLYALSGAGFIHPLPFRSLALRMIGLMYLVRGLLVLPQLWQALPDISFREATDLLLSLTALFIGLVYQMGTYLHSHPRWKS